jgi:hypothetical protein
VRWIGWLGLHGPYLTPAKVAGADRPAVV